MSDFMTAGGFGMYPVMVFGLVMVALAALQAARPAAERSPLIIGFGVATVLAGVLGTATGIRQAAMHIGELPAEQRWYFISGIGESLNCVVLAFVLAIVATLLTTAGAFRLARAATPAAALR